jgi:TRAP-type mannitol/chloroaromatic compound transport system substrate-binding protein
VDSSLPRRQRANRTAHVLEYFSQRAVLASQDALSREVMDSILTFRKTAIAWSELSEQSYMAARALPFGYAEPSGG